jgi:hypothetical protein
MCFATERIRNDIGLAWMIVYFQIIVFDEFLLAPLPHIQVCLSKDVLEAFVVSINMTFRTHQMMSPDLQGMNDSCEFKIMGGVVLFMNPECS